MFNIFKKKELHLYAPVNGKTIDLAQVPDKVFSGKMMGEGIAFSVTGSLICAPCSGKLIMIADTLHAFGIETDSGAQVLVHIGMDTVNLQGKGFKKLTVQNSRVKPGQPIIEIDKETLEHEGVDLTTPLIVTNSDEYKVTVCEAGKEVSTGDIVITVI